MLFLFVCFLWAVGVVGVSLSVRLLLSAALSVPVYVLERLGVWGE